MQQVAEDFVMVCEGEKLQLSYVLSKDVVSTGAFNAYAVLQLDAPQINEKKYGKRPKLAITAVVDRSASMGRNKLDLTKTAMHFITEQLHHHDLFGIITYDQRVRTNFQLTEADPKNQVMFQKQINGIRTGRGTNLSGGLLSGIEQQTEARQSKLLDNNISIIRAVLLCSDGLANKGITNTQDLATITKNQISNEQNLRVHTFGFGKSHDPAMLTEIAEAGQGDFYYVESEDVIPEAFGNVLGGLLSVAAQNIRIVITPIQPSFKLIKVWDVVTDFKAEADGSTIISMRDLKSEGQQKLLFEYSVDKTDQEGPQEIAKITVEYFNVATENMDEISCTISVHRQNMVPNDLPTNPEISSNIARAKSTSAIDEATKTAEYGNLEQARNILQNAREEVKKLNLSDKNYKNSLCGKLLKIEQGFKDKNEYQIRGRMTSRSYNFAARCQTARFVARQSKRLKMEHLEEELEGYDSDEYTMNKSQLNMQQQASEYSKNIFNN